MKMRGKTSTFDHKADRGNTLTKHFCPRCGSPMYTENEIRPTMIGLRAGVINELAVIVLAEQRQAIPRLFNSCRAVRRFVYPFFGTSRLTDTISMGSPQRSRGR